MSLHLFASEYNFLMLYLGADHRGFPLKESLKKWLLEKNIPSEDLGNKVLDPQDDFVDYAKVVAEKVAREKDARGIVICGSGIGVSIAANKIKGARCGLVFSETMAKQGREHDNINVLALPADFISSDEALKCLQAFLSADFFTEEKYQRRLNKVSAL